MEGCYGDGTALVVVDVQNDFADPAGSLYVRGAEAAVARVIAEVHAARDAGSPVVFTQDWHPAATSHFVTHGGVWPVHCVQGTWGAELRPDLPVGQADPIVRKGIDGGDGYSGFSVRDPESGEVEGTALERVLRDLGARRLVVVGIAQDVCVKDTVLDGRRLGFDVTVLTAATAPVELDPGDGERALAAMREAGATVV